MSFLFGGASKSTVRIAPATMLIPSEQDPNSVDPAKIEMAVAELDMITDVL